MSTTVTMPQLGETVVEGTILKWLKSEGETIERDEPLFEISTDKVDTEVPSPVAGTLSKILVQEGETVSVGTNLAEIDDGSAGQQTAEVSSEPAAETEPQEEEQAEEEAEEQEREQPKPAEEQPVGAASSEPEQGRLGDGDGDGQAPARAPAAVAAGPSGGGERSHILSPLVRRLAEEHQIDLGQIQGTGTGGRITKRDITAFIESGGAEPAPAAAAAAAEAGGREEVRPMSHIRKAIAKHMVASLQTTARAWNMVDVN